MDAVLHGIAPGDEQVAAYLNAFHRRMPGITSEVMLGLRSRDGYTSYEVIAERVAASAPAAVLDIGCGDGRLLAELHARSPHTKLAGIDTSAEEIALAIALLTEAGVDLHVGSASALPYPDAAFTAVVAHLVFMLIPRIDAALREAHRVLAPGGTFAFLLPRPPKKATSLTELLGKLTRKIAIRYPESSFAVINNRALSERFAIAGLLSQAGFTTLPTFEDFEVGAMLDGKTLWRAISGRYIFGSLDDELTAELEKIVLDAAANGRFDFRYSLRLVSILR